MRNSTTIATAVALALATSLGAATAAQAAVYGQDFGHVVILEDIAAGANDQLDTFFTHDGIFADSSVTLVGSSALNADAITESNTNGILYALSTSGELWQVDWVQARSRQIAQLTPPGGSDDLTYDSITYDPSSNRLFILRSGPGTGAIDTYDTVTDTYLANQYSMTGSGEISLSQGPAANIGTVNTGGAPAIYLLATGGNFEVLDPSTPGSTYVIGSGTTGLDSGNLVSLAPVTGNSTQMAILQDRNVGGDGADRVHLFNVDSSSRTANVASTAHTNASSITTSPLDGWVATVATGGGLSHIDTSIGTSNDFSAGTINTGNYQSLAHVDASSVERFVYIADDGAANHTDVFDTQYHDIRGYANNVLSNAATTTDSNADGFTDSSVTDAYDPSDGRNYIFQLHTDGLLYRIDPDTGVTTEQASFTSPSSTSAVYDAITNLPGTTKLFMLRTDRPTNSKVPVSGSQVDFIDVYDYASDTYTAGALTTVGTGPIDLTDGPDGNIYIIASGSSLEMFDPNASATTTTQIHTGFPGSAASGDDYLGITNIDGDNEYLYILRDRTAGDDVIDIYDKNGNLVEADAIFLSGLGGAVALTDTYERDLFVVATGGKASNIKVSYSGATPSLTGSELTLTSDTFVSVTNLGTIPEPTTLALLTLVAPALLRRR